MAVKYLTQIAAKAIDENLMGAVGGFSVDQLMELAGLSVAQAVQKSFNNKEYSRILVCVGPGNNGGDGLVAARHLFHFGYKPSIYYPKQPNKDLYQRLLRQCENLEIPVFKDAFKPCLDRTDVIIDSIFGFSFQGDVREPFKEVIQMFEDTKLPVVSVDIPSGWDVEKGPGDIRFQPEVLVSLTAPKQCAAYFRGKRHFLGGRFVPPSLAKQYGFDVPEFPGVDQVVELPML
ncbi:hypothetical protein EC973_003409 [Apophysomyces ossiformis]|uniref:NAD(P)H-hydrate epimerase n=1 Tax=Apophysomyces ossiformis TaxID=679940 RepID=A0A8H7BQQ4_9FUNG|nr:hypothetical protein EC973_003409 [Apophysomyces ossiformis]